MAQQAKCQLVDDCQSNQQYSHQHSFEIKAFGKLRIASKSNLSNADEELRQELLDRLIDSSLLGPTMQLSMNHDPRRLRMKELPHGNWTNMFLMYQAYSRAAGETPASRSTFFSVINAWKVCIKFHRRTHHQMCLTCSTLRSQIQGTSDSSPTISSRFWFPCQPLLQLKKIGP